VTGVSHASRRAALRGLLRIADVEAMLVTDLVNVRYLTGFTGSNASLLVHVDGDAASRFCTDGRYVTQSAAEVPDLERVVDRAGPVVLARAAGRLGVTRLGFESDAVTVDAHAALTDAAGDLVPLHRTPGLVARLRLVKDEAETAALRAACATADAALADLIAAGGLRPGRSERDVAFDLETRMRAHGAAGPSFATIVAAGPHSAVPHHQPTDASMRRGDLVKMDFGALVDGYHSDMTRTVVLGRAAGWQRDLHALVAAAQATGRSALRPGTSVVDVDAAARDVVVRAGYGDEFVHGLGHGVGLEIHEAPLLGPTGTGAVAAGMVVTVEPGVYLPGRGGVRIEDTVVVGRAGVEPLTRSPRELIEVV
jgi:Xaa-Pro aminopeptidase